MVEDPPAEVELPGLGVVALLGVEGERQQVVNVAGQEAGTLGFLGGLGVRGELVRVKRLDVPLRPGLESVLP